MKFEKIETPIKGLCVIKPRVFGDNRGFFLESWNRREFEQLGITCAFVQDNHSKSKRGVLRGLHMQTKHTQAKLIRCIKGKIFDVVVDLRKDSQTFGKYFAIELSEENKLMLFIPKNFAHGFLVISEEDEVIYKADDYYDSESDTGIIWNDSEINIDWKLKEYGIKEEDLIISEKDRKLPAFREFRKNYLKP